MLKYSYAILLVLLTSGCVYTESFSNKNLFLVGSSDSFRQVSYLSIAIKPFDETYDFSIKFPNGNIYHSTEITPDLLKNMKGVIITKDKNGNIIGYQYRYFKNNVPTEYHQATLSLVFYNNWEDIAFLCVCFSKGAFQIAPADKSEFYPIPITYEQAVKIFGKPDKRTKVEQYYGL